MRPKVVFDTNILFSATGWLGSPYQCLELARTGIVQHITCQEILEEFSEKLHSKLHFSDEQWEILTFEIQNILAYLNLSSDQSPASLEVRKVS